MHNDKEFNRGFQQKSLILIGLSLGRLCDLKVSCFNAFDGYFLQSISGKYQNQKGRL